MRIFAVFPLAIVLTGCAQMFDSNLFKNIDTPPKISTSSMASASLSDIKNEIADPNSASAFYQQLQNNPAALTALQGNLNKQISTAAASGDKATEVDAAQTQVLVTAYGTDTSSVVNNAINQASQLKSNSSGATSALQALMAGKSQTEIEAELNQFEVMQSAFKSMQTAADVSNKVDSTTFFGSASSSTQGNLAQIAVVTAAADALVQGYNGSVSALAAALVSGTISPPNSTPLTNLNNALSSAQDPASNNYAYLSAVTSLVTL
jgi:hypothetical protein